MLKYNFILSLFANFCEVIRRNEDMYLKGKKQFTSLLYLLNVHVVYNSPLCCYIALDVC